jgi:hypothetical protein
VEGLPRLVRRKGYSRKRIRHVRPETRSQPESTHAGKGDEDPMPASSGAQPAAKFTRLRLHHHAARVVADPQPLSRVKAQPVF